MTELPAEVRVMAEQWELRPDGEAKSGLSSIALPVRAGDGTRAVLKISFPDPASEHEHLVLRRWAGNGAVRLLRADLSAKRLQRTPTSHSSARTATPKRSRPPCPSSPTKPCRPAHSGSKPPRHTVSRASSKVPALTRQVALAWQ